MQENAIDQRDRAILRELMRDGRLTNAELAERVNLSPSACLRRVRALEEGVQRGHFIDGRLPHSLLLEIFTNKGIGTEIVHG